MSEISRQRRWPRVAGMFAVAAAVLTGVAGCVVDYYQIMPRSYQQAGMEPSLPSTAPVQPNPGPEPAIDIADPAAITGPALLPGRVQAFVERLDGRFSLASERDRAIPAVARQFNGLVELFVLGAVGAIHFGVDPQRDGTNSGGSTAAEIVSARLLNIASVSEENLLRELLPQAKLLRVLIEGKAVTPEGRIKPGLEQDMTKPGEAKLRQEVAHLRQTLETNDLRIMPEAPPVRVTMPGMAAVTIRQSLYPGGKHVLLQWPDDPGIRRQTPSMGGQYRLALQTGGDHTDMKTLKDWLRQVRQALMQSNAASNLPGSRPQKLTLSADRQPPRF